MGGSKNATVVETIYLISAHAAGLAGKLENVGGLDATVATDIMIFLCRLDRYLAEAVQFANKGSLE